MVPLVMGEELDLVKARIDAMAEAVQESGVEITYQVGTMIELPRAACAPARSRTPSSSPSAPTT
jgi:pyruvate,orthophosphate dikinase